VQHFAKALTEEGFSVELHILPDVGPEVTTEAIELTLELFKRSCSVSSF
jgi:hypothetical protein